MRTMRRKYWIFLYACILLIVVASTSVALGKITDITRPNKGVVFFSRLVTWQEAVDFSERYNVTPTSIYMASFGLSGTYRRYDRLNTKEFLKDADNRSLYVFRQAIKGNVDMIERFLQQYSLEDIKSNSAVLTEARSLLLLQYQLDNMYQRLVRRGNVIYAIEVSGINDENSDRIKKDIMTRKVVRFSTINKLLKHQVPDDADMSYHILLQKVNSMSPKQVYEAIIAISHRGGEQ